jgi:alpha-ribazole phosphatase
MKITFIRHGKTAGNIAKLYIGRTDESLCEEGRADAAARAVQTDVKCVFVSPMRRCRETAKLLFPNAEQFVIDDFREIDFGDFEGKSSAVMSDAKSGDPRYQAWVNSDCEDAIPNGESPAEFRLRVIRAFETMILSRQADASDIVIVAHGGVIGYISAAFETPKSKEHWWQYSLPNLVKCTADANVLDGAVTLANVEFADFPRSVSVVSQN